MPLLALGARSVLAGTSVLTRAAPPWDRLKRHLRGLLVLPADPAYATAKQLDLSQFDAIDPQAIAYCADRADVALCLTFAEDNHLAFAARSGGHSFGGYSTTPGLVIDVSRLNSVTLDDRAVTIGAGVQTVDALNALAPSGLAVASGAFPTVGAGGFIQGGGIGYLTRSIGLACDNMTAARVVLADGRTVTASEDEHPDLYWALRGGGGGNFGIVTSYTITPSFITAVHTASLSWDYDQAVEMLDGFTRWLADAPRAIGGAAVVVLPDAATGSTPVAATVLVSTGTASEFDTQVRRLISMASPPASQNILATSYQMLMTDTFGCGRISVPACHRVGTGPGAEIPPYAFGVVRGRMFSDPLPRSGWEAALGVFNLARTAGQAHKLEVLALGGAVNDVSRTATAYVHRDTLFDVNYLATVYVPPVPAAAEASARQWVNAGFAAIDPYSNGETYQNFIDTSLTDWRHAYYAENYARLVAIKARYDPFNAFRFAQSI
jgi:FAD/FMN-containing dehydrogenase